MRSGARCSTATSPTTRSGVRRPTIMPLLANSPFQSSVWVAVLCTRTTPGRSSASRTLVGRSAVSRCSGTARPSASWVRHDALVSSARSTTRTSGAKTSRSVSRARRDHLGEIERVGERAHDVVQRVEQVVGERHAPDLVGGLAFAFLGLEPELARVPADDRGRDHDDRREQTGAQRAGRRAVDDVGHEDRARGEQRGEEALAVPPAVRGEQHHRDRHEQVRAAPGAGERDRRDRDEQVDDDDRLGAPRGGIDLDRVDGAEDRVGEQHRARDVERGLVGLLGRDAERDAEDQARPAQPGGERPEPAELLDRARVEAGSDAAGPAPHRGTGAAGPRPVDRRARPGAARRDSVTRSG